MSEITAEQNRFVQSGGGIGQLPAAERARLAALLAEYRRREARRAQWPSPEALALSLSGGRWVTAPHLRRLSEWLVDAVEGRRRRLLVMCPPRHGKSSMCSHWLPVWALARRPSTRVLLCSYEAEFAASWGRLVRNTIAEQHERLGVRLSVDSAAAHRWETSAGGGMMTAGVGGPITGKGADLLLVDDPIKNDEEARSPTYRDRTWDWWQSTAYTRLEPGAAAVVVLTRWHQDDLAGRLLQQMAAGGEPWSVLRLPAVAEEGDQLGRAVGEALWPWRYPVEELERIRQNESSYVWSALFQQSPVPPEGATFKAAWFRPLPSDFDEPREDGRTLRQRLRLVQFWDVAHSDRPGADWTVALTVGVDASRNVYLLHEWRGRVHEVALPVAMAQHITATKPQLVGVEQEAYRQASTRDLLRLLAQRPELTHGCSVVPVKVTADKETRAGLPATRAELGLVYADKQARWWPEFEQELLRFPRGQHDDRVDALSGAVQLAVEGLPPPTPTEPRRWAWQREDTKPTREWDSPNERIDPTTGRRQGYNPFRNQWEDLPDMTPAGSWR